MSSRLTIWYICLNHLILLTHIEFINTKITAFFHKDCFKATSHLHKESEMKIYYAERDIDDYLPKIHYFLSFFFQKEF